MRGRSRASTIEPIAGAGGARGLFGICCALVALAALVAGRAPTAAAADACPNAAVRGLQGSAHLPDCRAFEQVTPQRKDGAEVDANIVVTQAAPDGEAVAFATPTALPGSQANVVMGTYRAARGPGGWTTAGIDPPQVNDGLQLVRVTRWISRDLRWAVDSSRLVLAPGALPGHDHVYLHNLVTGERRLVFQLPAPLAAELTAIPKFIDSVAFGPVWGATHDLSSFIFEFSETPLVPGASSVTNVYQWTDGELQLISRLPGGEPVPFGARALPGAIKGETVMSRDGSRVMFWTPPDPSASGTVGPAYVRMNALVTKLVSGSQRAGDDPTEGVHVSAQTLTSDGRYVFFISDVQMTDEPIVPVVTGKQPIYRYDLDTSELKLIGQGDSRLLAASDDGQRAYFASNAQLTPDAEEDTPQLYAWDNGATKLIAAMAGRHGIYSVQTSSDGRFAQFQSAARLTPDAKESSRCPAIATKGIQQGECFEIYAYDSVADSLSCISCTADGSLGHSELGPMPGYGNSADPASVLADGTYFFDTPNALVASDTNERQDVYEWKDGAARLLTTGTSTHDAEFRDASADGRDVFFFTRAKLVAQDIDDSRDVYDVRRDGGFVGQSRPSGLSEDCLAEGCQGSPAATPPAPAPGSFAIRSAGDRASCARLGQVAAKSRARAKRVRSRAHGLEPGAGKRALKKKAKRLEARSTQQKRSAAACNGGQR